MRPGPGRQPRHRRSLARRGAGRPSEPALLELAAIAGRQLDLGRRVQQVASDAPAASRKKRAAGAPEPKSRSGGVTPLDEQIRILSALGGDRGDAPAASRTGKAAGAPETTDRAGGVASLDELVLLLGAVLDRDRELARLDLGDDLRRGEKKIAFI